MGAEINDAQNFPVATRFLKEIAQIRSTPDQPSATPAIESVGKEFLVMENGRFEVLIWLFDFDEILLKV